MAGDPPQRKRKAMSETLFAAGSGSHSLFLTLFRHIERSIFTDFCPNVSLPRRFRVTSKVNLLTDAVIVNMSKR